jgi:hypothetical protein
MRDGKAPAWRPKKWGWEKYSVASTLRDVFEAGCTLITLFL